MIESIKCSLDQGKIVCAVMMDLSRAFDYVPHKLLMLSSDHMEYLYQLVM